MPINKNAAGETTARPQPRSEEMSYESAVTRRLESLSTFATRSIRPLRAKCEDLLLLERRLMAHPLKSQEPRALVNTRGSVKKRIWLVVAAGLMNLQVARRDGRRVGGAVADLQQRDGAVHHLDVEFVAATAGLQVVDGPSFERHKDKLRTVATVLGNPTFPVEVDDIDVDLRGSRRNARALVHDDVLALEVKAVGVVNHIPVAAIGRLGTASRVNDSAEAIIRDTLGLVHGTAAR